MLAIDLLMEQYRMLEERRTYFGKLFWQLPGFFVGVFAVFIGLADASHTRMLRISYFVGGAIMLLIAWIAYRLKASQDECERIIAQVEEKFRSEGLDNGITLPRSYRVGARAITLLALILSGVALMVVSVTWNVWR